MAYTYQEFPKRIYPIGTDHPDVGFTVQNAEEEAEVRAKYAPQPQTKKRSHKKQE